MKRVSAGVVLALAAAVGAVLFSSGRAGVAYGLAGRAARGWFHQSTVRVGGVTRRLPAPSGGLLFSAREAFRTASGGPSASPVAPGRTSLGCSNRTSGGDVRVNQDCTLRRQAEEDIAVNPTNPQNLIAAQNDSSIGWNHCGFDYSLDGGSHWGSGIPPFFARLNHPPRGHTIDGGPGTGHTYDVASDPSVAFDSRGNAYLSCILFDINDNASAVFVARSRAGADGSFYEMVPPAPARGRDHGAYVAVEDNTANASPDQEKIAADSFRGSPFRDRVYATWTEFINGASCLQGGQCYSSVFFSRSLDHGLTWSKPAEISGRSTKLCFNGNLFDRARRPHDCDLDEGSQPIVLPNGHVVVLFNNSNTAGVTSNDQILAVTSRDGGRTWSHPSLVGKDVVRGEPMGDTGDGNGPEECVPGPFIRVDDDPRAAVDPATGAVYAVWNDYAFGRYAIRLSVSSNGATWTENARPVDAGAYEDAYMASVGVAANHDLAVGFYGSARVPKEDRHGGTFKPGQSGVQAEPTHFYLATARSASGHFSIRSLTPAFWPPNGTQSGFNGDYSGMAVTGNTAHPIWSDTRNVFRIFGAPFTDEDVFTRAVPLR
jgi:hypothetical protein